MSMNVSKEATDQSVSKFITSFTLIAAGLGFIVDFITIVTISLSLGRDIRNSSFITPHLVFWILVLAIISYLGYLHSFWLTNRSSHSSDFSLFLIVDLIYDFRHPILLIPIIVAVLIFFWITDASSANSYHEPTPLEIIGIILRVILAIGIPLLLVIKVINVIGKTTQRRELIKFEAFKQRVDENWNFWEARIQAELKNSLWVDENNFKDLRITQEIPNNGFEYLLAKYSSLHRNSTEYDWVFKNDDPNFYRMAVSSQ